MRTSTILIMSSILLATHEPCCMCGVSSILWAGFPKVYYFISYAHTTAQGIPHDVNTMHELWGVNSYRKNNKYISTVCIMDLFDELDDTVVPDEKKELQATVQRLMSAHDALSNKYHTEKSGNSENNLVLG
jgi:tRNA(Arg) A34 adenosine deaminase TadA